MTIPDPNKCKLKHLHTPQPEGYIEWHTWTEQMYKTHRQKKCKGCGLWMIWEKKEPKEIRITNAEQAVIDEANA